MSLPTLYWQSDDRRATLYCGDCLELLPLMASGSVDAVVTDPPYGSNTNTKYTRFSGGKKGADHLRNEHNRINGDDTPFNVAPWLNFPTVILWGANHFSNQLPKGSLLIWDKRADNGHALLADAEAAWMSRGVGVYIFDHCWQGFARASETGEHYHPSQKPVALMEWCVARIPDCETILDPFAGSGTTGVACIQTGRRFIGIELSEKYCAIAARRLAAACCEDGGLFDPKAKHRASLFEGAAP